MMVYGKKEAVSFLSSWMSDKHDIVLVTGSTSYTQCGAELFFAPFFAGKTIRHFRTTGENAKSEDIDEYKRQLPEKVDAFVAIGGGTVIDTTKLLRGLTTAVPFLAVPTTAGTGAEATRFAVYYENKVKKSADDVRYLPTDQVLIPEFAETQSAYRRACTEFDAYAQAVESLWAKGATEESKRFAHLALELMKSGEQMLGSYWAGRAIDISRTTAAHAFSYYMTAIYGVPHGEAVYMMFPFICRANGYEKFILDKTELRTLDQFVADNGLNREEIIDKLFSNVNSARLGNNPCELRKEHFDIACLVRK